MLYKIYILKRNNRFDVFKKMSEQAFFNLDCTILYFGLVLVLNPLWEAHP